MKKLKLYIAYAVLIAAPTLGLVALLAQMSVVFVPLAVIALIVWAAHTVFES